MGTSNKNSCKTAAVMSLISRRPETERPAIGNVSDSDTFGGLPAAREQIEYIDIERIDDDPRNFYELSGLDELAANIEMLGLQQPIRVRPGEEPGRYIIVSGHRRRAAVRQLVMDGHGELRNIQCIVERNQESAAFQELRLILANSDTRKLTSFELGKQAERVNDLLYQLQEEEGVEFPGRMRDYVAEACKVSKSKLARLKVIRENLAKPWQPAYKKGKLAESTAYALAQMPAERQQVIYDGLTRRGTMPGSTHEYMVQAYGGALAAVDAVKCKTYGNGPCLNREAMQERIMGQSHYSYNWCRQCCDKCSELAKCKYACSMLADKVRQLKADAKAQKQQEQAAREEKERPEVEQIKALWKRFGEARAAAGESVEECYRAVNMYFSEVDAQKTEKRERLEGAFSKSTALPYGYSCYLSEVQHYVKLADLLGVSLDYLLCRTDDPAGFVPTMGPPREPSASGSRGERRSKGAGEECPPGCSEQSGLCDVEGQLVFNGWMPGGTLPRTPCDIVADFYVGDGVSVREVCWFDGNAFRFQDNGEAIDFEPVRWMVLPEVVSDSDTENGAE